MKIRALLLALLSLLAVAGCAPSADRPSLRPLIVKVSEPAAAGQPVTIQGRYLGGPANSQVIFRADENGRGGVTPQAGDVVSWTASEIVVKVPAGTRPGGGFLFVNVGGVLSNGMPYAVNP